ncbi:RNA polymerase sigma factor [Thalassotalea atypica]|uniref:RNA polymerase sigma factor n=1 Tax=Thalassotalea atypica TaxID=2054316 RepID=UPI0025734BE7|nr:sigma-70 family RNA polymerase sigma factor [Thalassotalea atypica]
MSHKKTQVEQLFRHEYGKLVAILSRRTNMQYIDTIEDCVQWALAQALEFWGNENIPENPSAWLYRVAYNRLLSEFKTSKHHNDLLAEHHAIKKDDFNEHQDISFSSEINDSMLCMLFAVCNDAIPAESKLVFTLKSLCGFSIREIALRLFMTEANAYKRYSRAKQHLKKQVLTLDNLTNNEVVARLSSIHQILYLMFTEGYLSSHPDIAIRHDLCEEAIRLAGLLVEHQLGDLPNSYALLALMYFHLARIKARQKDNGTLLLLEHQDRKMWDPQLTKIAMELLAYSASGDNISRYHIEAGIAAEHALSPSFSQTRWDKIIASYQLLERIAPSPLHFLNRAIATAECQGPQAGLAVLKSANIPHWLEQSYHWHAVQADLLFRSGEFVLGQKHTELAITAAPTEHIRQLLSDRLDQG